LIPIVAGLEAVANFPARIELGSLDDLNVAKECLLFNIFDEKHPMAQTSREFLAGLRSILWLGKSPAKNRNRRRLRRQEETSQSCESLEQRQLLVAQPISLTVNAGTTTAPITVQWVQPSTSPALSFDISIS